MLTFTCKTCNFLKSYRNFHRSPENKTGFCKKCKNCVSIEGKKYREKIKHRKYWRENKRKNALKYSYGISEEQYENMLKTQNRVCKICLTDKAKGRSKKYLHIDHCHKTNKIRGLLCHNCNVGLGNFKDNPKLLLKALDYLKGKI